MKSTVVNPIDLPPLDGASGGDGKPVLGERLDLVGHVKVKLTVALGDAEISLAKLFALSRDEVIALDRDIDAPVDIVLNDRVIARGALVAVGDNFGVRVTDIRHEA